MTNESFDTLERDGILVMDGLIPEHQLARMQEAFRARLAWPRWSDVDGYERTERSRLMVQHALTLDRGFVDLALHPEVTEIARQYLGSTFQLCEAKGWRTLETDRDFHGWHADAWYDQVGATEIPRELKLAVYLTDVRSGEFTYVLGSHRREHPRPYREHEVSRERMASVKGSAGTAFLFDTSGIHRQAVPVREDRDAVFYAYHDADVPLQEEDVAYNRYHPLLLSAAFLGDLSEEDRRILGFGDTRNHIHAFQRDVAEPGLVRFFERSYGLKLWFNDVTEPLRRRWPWGKS